MKSALEVVKAHRAEAERVVKDVKSEASKPITIAGVPGQPQPRPTGLERSLQPGYSDQADSYNRIITALKNGSTSVTNPFNNTSAPLNDATRDAVHFSGIWFRGAEQSLGKSYAPPTEAMLSSAWANIVQAISSLSSGDRKKLQKKLDKECRWRTWPNVN